MRALIALLVLSACSDPSIGVGFGIGTGGVSVSPVVSGTVGGVQTSVSAY
jgi:hypothetical protein